MRKKDAQSSWHGGKGSRYRQTDAEKFSDNWDKIFGTKKQKTVEKNESKSQTIIKISRTK
jgi:hypothetical protein